MNVKLYNKLLELAKPIVIDFCLYYGITKYSFPYDSYGSFMTNPFEIIIGYYLLFIANYKIYYNYNGKQYNLIYNNQIIQQKEILNINDMYYTHIVLSFVLINNIKNGKIAR